MIPSREESRRRYPPVHRERRCDDSPFMRDYITSQRGVLARASSCQDRRWKGLSLRNACKDLLAWAANQPGSMLTSESGSAYSARRTDGLAHLDSPMARRPRLHGQKPTSCYAMKRARSTQRRGQDLGLPSNLSHAIPQASMLASKPCGLSVFNCLFWVYKRVADYLPPAASVVHPDCSDVHAEDSISNARRPPDADIVESGPLRFAITALQARVCLPLCSLAEKRCV